MNGASNYSRFLISFIVAIAIGIPIAVSLDYYSKQRDVYANAIISTYNNKPRDVLYFGDSTIRFTGKDDKDKRGIDEFFKEFSGLSVCTIASPGFNSVLFSEYVQLLSKTRYKPRLVVLTVNLRSFSETGVQRPTALFPLRQIYTRHRCGKPFELIDYLRYRFLGLEEELTASWEKAAVIRDSVSIGTNRQIVDACRIEEDLDYNPELAWKYNRQLSLKFNYHYCMELDNDSLAIKKFHETVIALERLGIPVVLNITPLNMQDGLFYAGEKFKTKVENNLCVFAKNVSASNARILDLHESLNSTHFVHKSEVFEHLDTAGRRFVGEKVAEAALSRLSGK